MSGTSSEAVTSGNGEFIVRVLPTGEFANISPILDPGAGKTSAVTSAFFGVANVTSTSTITQLTTQATVAEDLSDTASYFEPELYFQGNPWHPGCSGSPLKCGTDTNTTMYMRAYYLTGAGAQTVQLPRAVMVTGYPNATEDPHIKDPSSMKRVHYTCGTAPNVYTPDSAWPYSCENFSNPQFDGVVMFVDFPECWNGNVSGNLNGERVVQYIDPNVKPGVINDLAYAPCPAGYKYRIPHVSLRVHTKIKNPSSDGSIIAPSTCSRSSFPCTPGTEPPTTGPGSIALGLSNAAGAKNAWYTSHAQYIQSWNMGTVTNDFSTLPPPNQDNPEHPGTLNDLTEDCLDAARTCGFQPNGSGSFIGG
jgi:hypothetical protein